MVRIITTGGVGHAQEGQVISDVIVDPDSPPVAPSWDAYDFKLRFTPDERIAVRNEAATNPYVADFLDMLDTAAATGTRVHADDALVTLAFYVLEQAGIITAERAAAILGAVE